MTKALAFLVLVSSCVSAFCLGMMAITLTTGELPLDTEPLIKPQESLTPSKEPTVQRPREAYVLKLYEELEIERQRLKDEAALLEQRSKTIKELERGLDDTLRQVETAETRIRGLMTVVGRKEIENVKRLARLVATMDDKSGASMLFGIDRERAARILYFSEDERSAKLLSTLVVTGDTAKVEWVAAVTAEMQRIASDIPELSATQDDGQDIGSRQ